MRQRLDKKLEPFHCLGYLFSFLCFCFSRQGFSVALEPVQDLTIIDQTGLELIEIHLPLPPKCWIKGVHHHRLASSTLTVTQNTELGRSSSLHQKLLCHWISA